MPVLHDHPFTRDNASEMARRSNETQRALRLAQARAKQEAREQPDLRTREVLKLIQEQIRETRSVLLDKDGQCPHCKRKSLDGKTRAQLLGALDRLLERERVWSQRPGPANLKPEPRRREHRPWAEPQEAGPQSLVVMPKAEQQAQADTTQAPITPTNPTKA